MNPEHLKQPEIFTMTDAELAAKVDADFRAYGLKFGFNHIEKTERWVDLKFALDRENHAQWKWRTDHYGTANENNRLTPEQEAAVVRYYRAQFDWLDKNQGDDLTPEKIARTVDSIRGDLEDAGRLNNTLGDVIDADEWTSHYAPGEKQMEKTPTHEKIARRFYQKVRDIQQRCAALITIPQAVLLREINRRTHRNTRRFFIIRISGDTCRNFRFTDVEISSSYGAAEGSVYAKFLHANFEKTIEDCRTVKEVVAVCDIWHTPTIVRTVAGARCVFSQEGIAGGVGHWLCVAPIELRTAEAHDEIRRLQYGQKSP